MGVFDSAKVVKINNKEVESIKTTNGTTIYQKPTAIITGNSLQLRNISNQSSNTSTGNVVINWGDGSANIVDGTSSISHTYTDNKQNHGIVLLGIITGLGNYCFYNCTGLTSITIPSSVTSLGSYCFDSCTGLTSITIPSSVTSLGNYCFNGCTSLTSVTIPSSVTNLGGFCFSNCNNLINYQLYWTGNNIITYDNHDMPNNTNTKFYIPSGQKTNYINKGYPSAKLVERS